MIAAIQGISKILKSGNGQVGVILLDIAKTFDKISFQRLLLKLNFYIIRDNSLQCISSFLHGRTQQVLVEGSPSEKPDVLPGVPHGTVLVSLLFMSTSTTFPLFANIPRLIRFPTTHTYIDTLGMTGIPLNYKKI